MPTPLASAILAQFMTATAGRNMTKAAYVAVATGIAMMILLSVDPAYEVAHHWIDALLWACLVFFIFEWVVRLRYLFRRRRGLAYALSGHGLVDAAGATAVPIALALGADPKTAWLLGVLWLVAYLPTHLVLRNIFAVPRPAKFTEPLHGVNTP